MVLKRSHEPSDRIEHLLQIEVVQLGGTPDLLLNVLPVGANNLIEDKVTVNVAKLDSDVTNNGCFDDLEDKAMNYWPGYSGDNRVLSNGTTFNTPGAGENRFSAFLKIKGLRKRKKRDLKSRFFFGYAVAMRFFRFGFAKLPFALVLP